MTIQAGNFVHDVIHIVSALIAMDIILKNLFFMKKTALKKENLTKRNPKDETIDI